MAIAVLLACAVLRAPRASAADAVATMVPVRLVVCVENLEPVAHPIRVAIDGQTVFDRRVRGTDYFGWFATDHCRSRTVRLAAGDHQMEVEEGTSHVVQQVPITVQGASRVRVSFWPWYQNGQFRQEPHFTVTVTPRGNGAS